MKNISFATCTLPCVFVASVSHGKTASQVYEKAPASTVAAKSTNLLTVLSAAKE